VAFLGRLRGEPKSLEALFFLWKDEPTGERRPTPMTILSRLTVREVIMGLLNAVYMKLKALIEFIERTDEEFLAGDVDDR
jgi:hypothetical protein